MSYLPVILVEADTISEGWIKALHKVWTEGKVMPQHYTDKMSKEATVIVNVKNPLKEPMIHRADLISLECCKLDGGSYPKELIEGTLDSKVDEGLETYTYHRRIWNYGKPVENQDINLLKSGYPILRFCKESFVGINDVILDVVKYTINLDRKNSGINQMEMLIQQTIKEPISRKLQVITWEPNKDLVLSGSPCLQRIWIRMIPKSEIEGETEFIGFTMETEWRSRDLHNAWGSNAYAMVKLGEWLAKRLSEGLKMDIKLLQYVDVSNSLHIYKNSFEPVEHIFETMKNRGMKI